MRELVEKRHDATRAFLAEVEHIVAVCEWVRDVLLQNGVPESKITLCRQGIDQRSEVRGQRSEITEPETAKSTNLPTAQFTKERPLRLVFLGRLDPTKGVHVLIEALQLDKSLPVALDVYGTAQGESGAAYAARVKTLAGNDARVCFCSPILADEVVPALRQYDLLAVPSQWLETAPLVVPEAFAAGIPVLGSNLGGIAELVDDGVNGILVSAGEIEAWCKTLQRLCADSRALKALRGSVAAPPTMSSVAQKMVKLYDGLRVPHHASA